MDPAEQQRPDPGPPGAVEVFGILAYGALAAFDRLAEAARLAPGLGDRVQVAGMAAQQLRQFDRVRDHLAAQGADVMAAMQPFHSAFDAYHERTRARDWLEGLVWVYVGNGFAADFLREVAALVDGPTRALVEEVLADRGSEDYVVGVVRRAVAVDPRVAGRLALWARRLVGEALGQAQQVVGRRSALAALGDPGPLFSRLVDDHARRMATLGLQA